MDVSEGTIKFHLNNILSKLQADHTEAVITALRRGIIKFDGLIDRLGCTLIKS